MKFTQNKMKRFNDINMQLLYNESKKVIHNSNKSIEDK